MEIFESEKDVAHLLSGDISASVCVPIDITLDKDEELIHSLSSLSNSKIGKILSKVNYDHPSLIYGSAILGSTSLNRNSELFLAEEMWPAIPSAVNTPFNDAHVEEHIIGHIISSYAVNKKGEKISKSENYFDVVVDFVVYKDIYPDIAQEIIEKAPKKKKFVSLETVAKGFDYALIDAKKNVKIIKRTKDTAFLTKYLVQFGGPGVYDGKRIVRVPRKILFVGMGNVDEPANPTSEYIEIKSKMGFYITKGRIMKIETLEQAEEIVAQLQTELDSLKSKDKEKEVETLKASVADLQAKLEAEAAKLEVATQKIAEKEEKASALETELTTIKALLDEKAKALDEINKQNVIRARHEKLASLGIKLDEEKVKKFDAMDDASFEAVVEFSQSLIKAEDKSVEETLETAKTEDTTVDIDASANASDTNERENVAAVAEKLIASLRKNRTDVKKINKK